MNQPLTKATWLAVAWLSLAACNAPDSRNSDNQKSLAATTGIDVVVISEAEKITHATATLLHTKKPLADTIHHNAPIYLPGISLLVDGEKSAELIDTLNSWLQQQHCMAFISEDHYRGDHKKKITIVRTADKYDIVRMQETCSEVDSCCTDSLIVRLKQLELKYTVDFIAVARDWMIVRPHGNITDWHDYARETLKVCPLSEEEPEDIEALAVSLQEEKGKITLWWE
ncbi:protein of unknown function [Filimonas lacunae]|uniref:DUF4253 domain-containing protein n=1 Tax=Filimonas lacunae TaxID=477680 RepID=A0A173ME80_9BACT|nr:DUF4253 domain-containing protein [Filimonas lacunae]BAV05827.1 hypothetical protein FLA_1839 [Filimonas lacunae]SIT28461.1 protein of unknown function [Filimonas lacunae]